VGSKCEITFYRYYEKKESKEPKDKKKPHFLAKIKYNKKRRKKIEEEFV
jgi:hypothetical protein